MSLIPAAGRSEFEAAWYTDGVQTSQGYTQKPCHNSHLTPTKRKKKSERAQINGLMMQFKKREKQGQIQAQLMPRNNQAEIKDKTKKIIQRINKS